MHDLTDAVVRDRYRVVELIGRGGMAEVYKVWDKQRAVHLAMKVLREDLSLDRVFLRRFRREAQTLAGLQHPNIVRFYRLEQDGRLAFMLLDFIEGETLKHEIFDANAPLPLGRVLRVMRAACAGLHYAHQQGVIHADVKPANLMTDHSDRVLVTDFGIARMTDAATATMVGMGTPAYMAPEQVRGSDPTPQTDVYSLGVVLYEMLTGGERPFTGQSARVTGSTSEKVRWEQVYQEPPSPRRHNSAISSGVESVVMHCLAKETHDRFPSTLELLAALEAAVVAPTTVHVEGHSPESDRPVAEGLPAPKNTNPLREESRAARTSRARPVLIVIVTTLVLAVLGAMLVLRNDHGALQILAESSASSSREVRAEQPSGLPDAVEDEAANTPLAPPTATSAATPTSVPTPTSVSTAVLLYSEDFETGVPGSDWTSSVGTWSIEEESNGNHFWLGTGPRDYPQRWFGDEDTDWTNYAFESRIKFISGTVFICARAYSGGSFYTAYVDSSENWVSFAEYDGSEFNSFGGKNHVIRTNQWYTIRFELEDDALRLYIDDELVASARHAARDHGGIGYYMGGEEEIHVDDIRVWSLNQDDVDTALYDNFNSPEFEGAYSASLWSPSVAAELLNAGQQGGVLEFRKDPRPESVERVLMTRHPDYWMLNDLDFFEAKLRLSDDPVGSLAFVKIQLTSGLPSKDWWTQCRLNGRQNQPADFVCDVYTHSGDEFIEEFATLSYPIQYNTWYDVRIEVDDQTGELRFYLDNQLAGSYTPADANELRSASFSPRVGIWQREASSVSAQIDDVRIGR